MKSTIKILLLLTFIYAGPLNAQQNKKLDSLLKVYQNHKDDTLKVKTLAHLYNSLLYTDPETALKYAREELRLSEKLHYSKGIGWSTYHIGAYYLNGGNIDSARYYLNRSMEVYKESGEEVRYSSVLGSLAYLEYSEGNYDTALAKFDEVIEIVEKYSAYIYAISLGDRANVYISKGFYKIALEETLKALRVLDTIYEKPWRRADAQRQVGQIEYLRKNYNNSLEYFKQALDIYKEQDDNVYQAHVYNDISNVFYQQNAQDSARFYHNKSLELAREHKISEAERQCTIGIGKGIFGYK